MFGESGLAGPIYLVSVCMCVAQRIKNIKKPKTKIRGDIFPSLLTESANILAQPLSDIYNRITETFEWPAIWKVEIVTVIPKCGSPESFD